MHQCRVGASRERAAKSNTALTCSGATPNWSTISSMVIPSSRFSKTVATGIRVPRKTHAPLILPGSLSTARHCDQSIPIISIRSALAPATLPPAPRPRPRPKHQDAVGNPRDPGLQVPAFEAAQGARAAPRGPALNGSPAPTSPPHRSAHLPLAQNNLRRFHTVELSPHQTQQSTNVAGHRPALQPAILLRWRR